MGGKADRCGGGERVCVFHFHFRVSARQTKTKILHPEERFLGIDGERRMPGRAWSRWWGLCCVWITEKTGAVSFVLHFSSAVFS